MDLLLKISTILALFLIVYLWNRFIIKNMIKAVVGFHKRNNGENLDKQPVKFLIQNEHAIYRFSAGFYWIAIVLISIVILFNE